MLVNLIGCSLSAANGLTTPYIGYLELDVELCGKLMPQCRVMVAQDPPGGLSVQVPGVLVMNVIRRCYRDLFGQHSFALFDLPSVFEAPELVVQALQKYHHASVQAPQYTAGRTKIGGRKVCCIPGGVMKIVEATCSEQYSSTTVLFEPLDSGLPAGLLADCQSWFHRCFVLPRTWMGLMLSAFLQESVRYHLA